MQGRPAQPGARWWREKLRPTGLQFEGIAAPVKVFLRVFSAPPLDVPAPRSKIVILPLTFALEIIDAAID